MIFAATINGADKIINKLKRTEKALMDAVKMEVKEAAILIHENAVKSIQAHMSSGNIYIRGTTAHVASKEGFPPNSDTGRLVASIKWVFKQDGSRMIGLVGTNLDYGAALEFGTSHMRERPWLAPAVENSKIFEKVELGFKVAVDGIK
jgi:HK97 gp10 family phage protein